MPNREMTQIVEILHKDFKKDMNSMLKDIVEKINNIHKKIGDFGINLETIKTVKWK